jgi:MATE family multidrug resistance protein
MTTQGRLKQDRTPGGFREFFSVAYPLVISNMSISLMVFVDRLFLSWSSAEEIAASLPAGILGFTATAFFLGLCEYTNTFVAQFHGADRPQDVSRAVWQGIWLAFICGVVSLPFIPLGVLIFSWSGHAPEIIALEEIYFRYVLIAILFQILNASVSSFYSGRGKTKVIMSISLVANMLNGVLDYGLIFGAWGFPQWGIKGAAIATLAANIFSTILYFSLFLSAGNNRLYQTRQTFRLDWRLMKRLLRFGTPSGIEFLLTIGSFTVFIFLIGQLGVIELAASNIVLSLNMLAFFPMIGVTIATSTLVGQYIGRQDWQTAEKSAYTAFYSVQVYMLGFALIYYLFPEELIQIFHQNEPSANIPFTEIVAYGTQILFLVAIYQIFDAMTITFSGALRGAGDTYFAMWASIICAWIIFVPGLLVVIHVLNLGVVSAWIWATFFIALTGLVYLQRFRSGYWKTIRVIPEQEEIPAGLTGVIADKSAA